MHKPARSKGVQMHKPARSKGAQMHNPARSKGITLNLTDFALTSCGLVQ